MAGRGRASSPVKAVPIELAPIVLILGKEGLLIDRALATLKEQARQRDPNCERHDLSANTYSAGQLDMWTSPSLFGEQRLIIIDELQTMTDALATDLESYVKTPAPDVWMILVHPGGNAKGKRLLDAIKKAGHPVISADPLKYDNEKLAFLKADAKRMKRSINDDAAQLMVDALGDDLRSLAAALTQLLSDVDGNITIDDVRRYYSGRIEATGFNIADAAVEGRAADALTLLRHALAVGVDPVPIVWALGNKLRQLAKLTVTSDLRTLGMSPAQANAVRTQLRGWNDASLSGAIEAVAQADAEVKGGSRDRERAIEKAVIQMCRLRGRNP